jgi:hypothetical protein
MDYYRRIFGALYADLKAGAGSSSQRPS